MPRDALPAIPPPCVEGTWSFAHGGDMSMLTGDIYTDGSGLSPIARPEANRAGWGVAMMNGQALQGIAYGPLPGHQQSVPRAELYAVIQVLRHRLLPIHIRTDCLGTVDGLMGGPEWCTHPRRQHCDLWRVLWQIIQDHGGLSSQLE
eukprot:4943863-Pyramimonas_sp.AAC.1